MVHQWVPAAHRGDAVGDNARALRALLRGWGHEAEIFALTVDDELRGDILPWGDALSRQGDVTILHFAMPSPLTAALATLPGARVLCYHNVTPPHFFAPFDPGLTRLTVLGRRELQTLAGRVDLATGVSEYNRRELETYGFAPTAVLPLLVDTERLTRAGRVPALEALLQDGLTNILFVGRIAPNKKIEDHIRLAEHYKRYVDVYYRFIFVGKYDAVPRYYDAVRALITEYRMLPERFWFPGPVGDQELAAYYRNAHAYVSLSEHEGFCAPLVEAMAMDVPVLAYAAAAVPETLGGAGVSFAPKDLEFAAELLGGLIYDLPMRDAVIERQRARLQDFSRARLEPRVLDALAAVGVTADEAEPMHRTGARQA
jgi:glycosyltransferase involved in cell wall biosynthesis